MTSIDVPKPMRPLTAYHIFFQIEREYIIQNAAGPDADATIHDNKSYIPGVPRRYRCIKLLPDWYAGPGKRQKRKHRKSHGKVGFHELSCMISKRWATLDTTDPETKQYVAKIAAKELAAYKLEMKEYKRLTVETTVANAAADAKEGALVSPSASPLPSSSPVPAPIVQPTQISSTPATPYSQPAQSHFYCQPVQSASFCQAVQTVPVSEDGIDYSICRVSNNGHYLPCPGPMPLNDINAICSDESICDPLFELEDGFSIKQASSIRCVSPDSVGPKNVGAITADDLLRLLAC
jgi:hypothetical protein